LKHPDSPSSTGHVYCTLCGEEIGEGETYWIINGTVICGGCLPDFARWDYRFCQVVRGEEGERL